jgi:hypothetical protein
VLDVGPTGRRFVEDVEGRRRDCGVVVEGAMVGGRSRTPRGGYEEEWRRLTIGSAIIGSRSRKRRIAAARRGP